MKDSGEDGSKPKPLIIIHLHPMPTDIIFTLIIIREDSMKYKVKDSGKDGSKSKPLEREGGRIFNTIQ